MIRKTWRRKSAFKTGRRSSSISPDRSEEEKMWGKSIFLTAVLLFLIQAAEAVDHINANPAGEKGVYTVCPVFEKIMEIRVIPRGGPHGKSRVLKEGDWSFDFETGRLGVKAEIDNEREMVIVQGEYAEPRAWLFEKIEKGTIEVHLNDRKLEEGKGYEVDYATGKITILDSEINVKGAKYFLRAGGQSIGNYVPDRPTKPRPAATTTTATNASPTGKPNVYSISHCPMTADSIDVSVARRDETRIVKKLKKDEDYRYVEDKAEIILLKEIEIDAEKEYLFVMGTKKDGDSTKKIAKSGTCSVSGRVVDNRGNPVRGAKIKLNCEEHGLNEYLSTDKEGRYSMEGLKAGFYSVMLEKGKNWNGRHKMQQIESGEDAVIDFVPLTDAASFCGEVLDTRGKPIEKCYVSITNLHYYKEADQVCVQDFAWTDDEGFFAFDNLPPTKFNVTIARDGVVCMSPGGTFEMERGVEKEVTIKVQPGTMNGKLIVEGKASSGFRGVHLIAREQGEFSGKRWSTNSEGEQFSFQNLPPGNYYVTAYLKGYFSKPTNFTVKKSGKSKDIEVKLSVAGTVLFKILDRNGEPVNGVTISQVIPGKGTSSVQMDRIASGVYKVFSIEPGRHEFDINSSVVGNTKEKVTVRAGKETEVEVTL
jgi:protocatechuate 3,4-dioxygenase beta subunit